MHPESYHVVESIAYRKSADTPSKEIHQPNLQYQSYEI
ncbi:hypothetical protein ACFL1R_04935 [Candidatus Latescibacterota bacterium]